eukprot:3027343-Pyramimonas_sp.AAC.2
MRVAQGLEKIETVEPRELMYERDLEGVVARVVVRKGTRDETEGVQSFKMQAYPFVTTRDTVAA